MISLDHARALLLGDLPALAIECVALDEALGRTLAEPLIASHTQPIERRATMDGIAVPDAEPVAGAHWRLVGEIPAGAKSSPPLQPGNAARIATGAVVPKGAERVIPQEMLQFSDTHVTLNSDAAAARFVRQPGADFKQGERLLDRGVRIGPAELGLIAAANCADVHVFCEPRVTVCSAGDELIAPGMELHEGQSVDSATHTLAALIRLWGGKLQASFLLPDDFHSIVSTLSDAAERSDVVLCIGGASVGARDLMRPAANAIGAQFLFQGIAVQPGKPCWHARHKGGSFILGLPGNPSSALVCAHLLLLPFLEKLMERPSTLLRQAYLTTQLPANGEREQYLRATASLDREGRLLVSPLENQDSGLQANLAKAQVLIRRRPEARPLNRGAKVEVLALGSIR